MNLHSFLVYIESGSPSIHSYVVWPLKYWVTKYPVNTSIQIVGHDRNYHGYTPRMIAEHCGSGSRSLKPVVNNCFSLRSTFLTRAVHLTVYNVDIIRISSWLLWRGNLEDRLISSPYGGSHIWMYHLLQRLSPQGSAELGHISQHNLLVRFLLMRRDLTRGD